MRKVFFNLTKQWDDVNDFFKEMMENEEDDNNDSYSCVIDSNLVAICWLSQRIYDKYGIVNIEIQEIALPFDLEIAIYQDAKNLVKTDHRLLVFDAYLDCVNFDNYICTDQVTMKVINKIMFMVEK